jgi:hypothetical protein
MALERPGKALAVGDPTLTKSRLGGVVAVAHHRDQAVLLSTRTNVDLILVDRLVGQPSETGKRSAGC